MPIYMDVLRIERLVVIIARGHVTAEDSAYGGRPASVELTLPPLAGLYLSPA